MVTTDTYIYTDLDELPIYNFYKCVDGKLEYLYEQKKGDVNNKINEVWNKLYNDYCKITITKKQERYYRLLSAIKWLEDRLIYTPIIIESLLKTPIDDRDGLILELKEWKLFINTRNNLDSELSKCLKILNNSKSKIKRKHSELSSINNNENKDTISLSSQKTKLHKLLGLDIDTKTTSVTEWVSYWNDVKDIKQEKNVK